MTSSDGSGAMLFHCVPTLRGTRIVLGLKEVMQEYLREKRPKELAKNHSEFIGFPINKLYVEKDAKTMSEDEEDNKKTWKVHQVLGPSQRAEAHLA